MPERQLMMSLVFRLSTYLPGQTVVLLPGVIERRWLPDDGSRDSFSLFFSFLFFCFLLFPFSFGLSFPLVTVARILEQCPFLVSMSESCIGNQKDRRRERTTKQKETVQEALMAPVEGLAR
jgi:hypothetical protein